MVNCFLWEQDLGTKAVDDDEEGSAMGGGEGNQWCQILEFREVAGKTDFSNTSLSLRIAEVRGHGKAVSPEVESSLNLSLQERREKKAAALKIVHALTHRGLTPTFCSLQTYFV